MRPDLEHLSHWRIRHPLLGLGNETNGCFLVTTSIEVSPGLRIIFSRGGGWEHASVSRAERCPTWDEMAWVKRQFWQDDEAVMELHVPPTDHVNNHKFCLHLWRPYKGMKIPRPPVEFV